MKKLSEEHKTQISVSLKGKPGNNTGKHWKVKDTSKMKGSITSFKKGHIGYGKGKSRTLEVKSKISLSNKGKKRTDEMKRRLSEKKKGIPLGHGYTKEIRQKISKSLTGKIRSEESKLKQSKSQTGKKFSIEHKEHISKSHLGEKHWAWKKDRTQLKGYNSKERRSSAYVTWRNEVYKRDNWKCKINNQNCNGRIEAHHILGFTKYPELRYDTNNGITLCHFHHPLKRNDEIKLSLYFMELVKSNNFEDKTAIKKSLAFE